MNQDALKANQLLNTVYFLFKDVEEKEFEMYCYKNNLKGSPGFYPHEIYYTSDHEEPLNKIVQAIKRSSSYSHHIEYKILKNNLV